jgi:hypothetical protein
MGIYYDATCIELMEMPNSGGVPHVLVVGHLFK